MYMILISQRSEPPLPFEASTFQNKNCIVFNNWVFLPSSPPPAQLLSSLCSLSAPLNCLAPDGVCCDLRHSVLFPSLPRCLWFTYRQIHSWSDFGCSSWLAGVALVTNKLIREGEWGEPASFYKASGWQCYSLRFGIFKKCYLLSHWEPSFVWSGHITVQRLVVDMPDSEGLLGWRRWNLRSWRTILCSIVDKQLGFFAKCSM